MLILTAILILASAAEYSPDLGLRAMYLSGAAYCEGATVLSWKCGEACSTQEDVTNITTIEVAAEATFGYVALQKG